VTHISIIIPAHNEARFLPRALGSLRHSAFCLADDRPGVRSELIVVDNASTDATASIAAEYGATVVREPHRNVAHARNTGASAARGDLLAFIDADYRVPLEFLPTLDARFEADRRLTAAGVKVLLEPAEIDPVRRASAAITLGLLRRVATMSFGVFLVRHAHFDGLGGFDESLYAYEDVEFLRRVKNQRTEHGHYRILNDLTVYTSARGYYRGGMTRSYARMALSPQAWRDPAQCRYWYAR
jgi:glycosyltransferase involved in cell wall biosynthesis